ncbi:MAG: hypothetical protein FGF50_09685 [Candidatus Brockarchaeota archaeon]|nr:hypothetical protein [Candidatus Brockarchaeota archaeon]
MAKPGSSSPEEHEIVIELTLKRLIILILLAIPVLILVFVGLELVSAYYGQRSLIIDFTLERETLRPGDEAVVSVRVSSGVLGSLIKIPAGSVDVAIELRNPGGDVVFVDQGTTNTDGTLEFRFRIPEAVAGEYVFYLACEGGSNSGRLSVQP